MPVVILPIAMRRFSVGRSRVRVESGPLREVFAALNARCPGIRTQIFDDNGTIRRYLKVFVNGLDIRSLKGHATQVRGNDEIHIVPSLARR